MSDFIEPDVQGPAIPLSAFALEVGPRHRVERVAVRVRGADRIMERRTVETGGPREVWLKLLAIRHPNERHTSAEWHALIDRYAAEPAHPHHPDFVGNRP